MVVLWCLHHADLAASCACCRYAGLGHGLLQGAALEYLRQFLGRLLGGGGGGGGGEAAEGCCDMSGG